MRSCAKKIGVARPDLSYPRARIALGVDTDRERGPADPAVEDREPAFGKGRPYAGSQLAAQLGVTRDATIQRDIAVLEAAGFPVTSEPRDGTVYWRLLDTTKETAELSFTLADIYFLYIPYAFFSCFFL